MMQDYLEVGEELWAPRPRRDRRLHGRGTPAARAVPARSTTRISTTSTGRSSRSCSSDGSSRLDADDDLVVVPTASLYIEALVGTHPLLEDFKLLHRALDVKKVQAEVRHAELENVRLAARALKGKDEDPDIEKKVVIENGAQLVIDTE